MDRTNLSLEDAILDAVDVLRPIGLHSFKRNFTPQAAVHWMVELEDVELARTTEVATLLHLNGYRAICARQASDRISLTFARCGPLGFETIGLPAPFCRATDPLLRCPRGLFLAIFGPDGAGKSSISSATVAALSPLFDHTRTVCWRPQLISSRTAKEPHKFKLPHDAVPHNRVTSMVKIAGACLDFFLDHASLTRNQLRGCTLIAWDRYLHDVAVDRKRYRYTGPSWYLSLLLRSVPIPEHFLGIVLDADENAIFKRKREVTPEELRRQRVGYAGLTSVLPETHVVKNDGDFDSCLRRVLSLAIARMAGWFEPIAQSVLNIDLAN